MIYILLTDHMMYTFRHCFLSLLITLIHLLLFCGATEGYPKICKSTPDDISWPNNAQWKQLNESLDGRLLQPSPPALPCRSVKLGSNESCADVMQSWSTFSFHQNDPISTAWNNMNNDSCLPDTSTPCSSIGYPVYVVNATSANHVKLATDFAREFDIRLNVKASGHDYIRRSASPFSLSIWTRYMVGGYQYHETFSPKGCRTRINTTAVTAGAGSHVSEIYLNLALHNMTIVDGMGPEVTMGGYLTGGGHSPISNIFGLGADQVYEVEMVTPTGEIIVANECQNTDLFWAVRGGGGSTFGVLTRVTVRTVPSTPVAIYNLAITTAQNSTAYWDSLTYLLAQFPALSDSNVSSYTYVYPVNSAAGPNANESTLQAIFALYNPASDTELEDLLAPYVQQIKKTYSNQLSLKSSSILFPTFYNMFLKYADDAGAGVDKVVGSWLLPPATLTRSAFRNELIKFLGSSGGRLYMVSGKGVWNASPRGGSNAVNPAWRKALIHAVTSDTWAPLDNKEKATVEKTINEVQVEAFRRLVPESGAYLNEAYLKEPNYQRAFWGSNYERLHSIKKTIDPDDVFWCPVCVGNENWQEVGDRLCRV